MESSTQALFLFGGAAAGVYFLYQESKKQQKDTPPDPIKGFYPVKTVPVDDNPATFPKPMCGFQVIHAHDRGVAWDKAMTPFDVSKEACFTQAALQAADPFLASWKKDDQNQAWENGANFESPLVYYDADYTPNKSLCWFIQMGKDAQGKQTWTPVQNICPNLLPKEELTGQ
jgi:hypothetical protein